MTAAASATTIRRHADPGGRRMKMYLACALAASLLFGACSGGDSSSDPPSTTTTSEATTTTVPTERLYGTLTLSDASARDELGGPCNGSGGFSDIREGAQVTVSDGAGEILSLSRLSNGVRDDIVHCRFTFEVEEVPPAEFYEVSVGNRDPIAYSADELEDMNWRLDLTLG